MRLPGTYISPAETGFYATGTRYYDSEISRFINADGSVSTGQGILGNNMFAYCGNNPVNRKDMNGESWVVVLAIVAVCTLILTGSSEIENSGSYIKNAKEKPNFVPNPNKRKGSGDRQPTGDRERNVGHPNGEEHSRVPKGNRGVRRIEATVGIVAASLVIAVLVADNATGVGIADDVALGPTAVIWWDYAMVLF